MKLISDSQTCSILGRRMNDNVTQIRDIIDDANLKNKELFIVSVDQSKAFDSISHKNLFKLLKHLNLGNSLKTLFGDYTITRMRVWKQTNKSPKNCSFLLAWNKGVLSQSFCMFAQLRSWLCVWNRINKWTKDQWVRWRFEWDPVHIWFNQGLFWRD